MDAFDGPGVAVDADRLIGLRFVAAEARRLAARRTSARPGPFVTRRRGRGSETDDVRVWTHGDDVRHIDRNVTARTGVPHVRTFRDERERTTLLLADFRPSMLFGTRRAFLSVAGAEALALVGWQVAADGGRVGALTLQAGEPDFVKPAVGDKAMVAALGGFVRGHRRALAAPPSAPVPPLSSALETAARLLPPGGTLVVATALDDRGPDFEEAVRRVAHRVALGVLLVADAFEDAPPKGVYPFAERGGRRGVGLVEDAALATGTDPRVALLAALGASVLRVRADAAPEAVALSLGGLDGGRA